MVYNSIRIQCFVFEIVKKNVCRKIQGIVGIKYSRMDQVKNFQGSLPQILRGPFLNTLPHLKGCPQTDIKAASAGCYIMC